MAAVELDFLWMYSESLLEVQSRNMFGDKDAAKTTEEAQALIDAIVAIFRDVILASDNPRIRRAVVCQLSSLRMSVVTSGCSFPGLSAEKLDEVIALDDKTLPQPVEDFSGVPSLFDLTSRTVCVLISGTLNLRGTNYVSSFQVATYLSQIPHLPDHLKSAIMQAYFESGL